VYNIHQIMQILDKLKMMVLLVHHQLIQVNLSLQVVQQLFVLLLYNNHLNDQDLFFHADNYAEL
jgi:hypothetical protein